MSNIIIAGKQAAGSAPVIPSPSPVRTTRVGSIDLLRGIIMIIMILDHVRAFFHRDAYLYDPTDLQRTSAFLFLSRWITHYCAPNFVFLAGLSACLYGARRSKRELSFFLLSRGIWLVLMECFIVTLGWTFNPSYPLIVLQVIWAIGISMIILSALIWLDKRLILVTGIVLIAAHNLLDTVHFPGTGAASVLWSLLHERGLFPAGHFSFLVFYPVLPWIGIMAVGYCLGAWYAPGYDPVKRRKALRFLGLGAILLFILLRSGNFYGDPAPWSAQKNVLLSLLSFVKTTKYPPSLLYILMTLGPALIFLSLAEKPLNALTAKIAVFGRVPMFYYVTHIFLVHGLAVIAVVISGHKWTDMILTRWITEQPELKGYGFSLLAVYLIWIGVILILYPFCKRYDRYKRANLPAKKWLSYF